MKQIFALLLLLAITGSTYAQEKSALISKSDSLLNKLDKVKVPSLSLPDTLKTSFSKAESIKNKTQTKYDITVNLIDKPQEELTRYTFPLLVLCEGKRAEHQQT